MLVWDRLGKNSIGTGANFSFNFHGNIHISLCLMAVTNMIYGRSNSNYRGIMRIHFTGLPLYLSNLILQEIIFTWGSDSCRPIKIKAIKVLHLEPNLTGKQVSYHRGLIHYWFEWLMKSLLSYSLYPHHFASTCRFFPFSRVGYELFFILSIRSYSILIHHLNPLSSPVISETSPFSSPHLW